MKYIVSACVGDVIMMFVLGVIMMFVLDVIMMLVLDVDVGCRLCGAFSSSSDVFFFIKSCVKRNALVTNGVSFLSEGIIHACT